jgi:hypothetical protein
MLEHYSKAVAVDVTFEKSRDVPNNQHYIVNEHSSFAGLNCLFSESFLFQYLYLNSQT